MPEELNPAEKERLKNIESFNRSIAEVGWRLRDKIVREDLSSIRLNNSAMFQVQFEGAKFHDALVSNSIFTGVLFDQADFDSATLNGVTFSDCVFRAAYFNRARMERCRFTQCRFDELAARDAHIDGCVFERCEDNSGVFGGSAISDTSFADCLLRNTSIQRAELRSVVFRKSTIEKAVFSALRGRELRFTACTLRLTGFGESEFELLTFEGCTISAVTFSAFDIRGFVLRHALAVSSFAAVRCSWSEASVSGCEDARGLRFIDSSLETFSLERCRIAYLRIEGCRILGSILQCRLSGANFTRIDADGLRIAETSFDDYFVLEKAALKGLQLAGVKFEEGMEFRVNEVEYGAGSDRFKF